MTLLQEVIDGASGDEPVNRLLRKVKVIAARAEVPVLEEWVDHELGGYPEEAALPDYRGPFDVQAFGHFTGPFQSEIKNAPIPGGSFPESFSWLFELEFRQPIAELESLAAGKALHSPWPADIVAGINGMLESGEMSLYGDHRLLDAWRSVSVPQLTAIVDSVRTRVLDLALAVEKTAPEAGQAGAGVLGPEAKQTIITHVYGDNPNVAVASSDFAQSVTINKGDENALRSMLLEIGLPGEMVDSLFVALQEDEAGAGGIGPATSGWLSAAIRTAYQLGIGTSAGLIANSVFAYLGLG
jgi:hypothetical protein